MQFEQGCAHLMNIKNIKGLLRTCSGFSGHNTKLLFRRKSSDNTLNCQDGEQTLVNRVGSFCDTGEKNFIVSFMSKVRTNADSDSPVVLGVH